MCLRLAIEKARDASMPVDNIKRAIQRVPGEGARPSTTRVVDEDMPRGTAVMVSNLTDNKNRTVADLRSIFSRNAEPGETGCVAWMFEQKGVISISTEQVEKTRCSRSLSKPAPRCAPRMIPSVLISPEASPR